MTTTAPLVALPSSASKSVSRVQSRSNSREELAPLPSSQQSVAAPHDATSPSLLPEHDRAARQQWVHEQLQERKKRREQEDHERQLEREQLQRELWKPFERHVSQTHELNIAWKHGMGFFSWDRVLALTDPLEALRVTGHTLVTLPTALVTHVSATLTTLSLIANSLESLPDNVRSSLTLPMTPPTAPFIASLA
ncbi:hypothetical protein PINS_up009865 [Pythium insidiosum]|nr:hypothetical protein PINS_up009865 [Pythium insidiosum]